MFSRFVTKEVHAYLDYPVALGLIAAPFVLGLSSTATLLSVATGIAAFILTILTDHHLGIIRVLPYALHVAVDRVVGLMFIAAPLALNLNTLEASYFYFGGGAVLLVTTLLNSPEEPALQR